LKTQKFTFSNHIQYCTFLKAHNFTYDLKVKLQFYQTFNYVFKNYYFKSHIFKLKNTLEATWLMHFHTAFFFFFFFLGAVSQNAAPSEFPMSCIAFPPPAFQFQTSKTER
jgi:hypothetical protein